MITKGVINREDLNLFKAVETASEAWEYILDWYDIVDTEI